MHHRGLVFGAFALLLLSSSLHNRAAAEEAGTRLLRQPAISKDHLAFVYAGDIWISDRDGGHPTRLTTHPASELGPHFSPDGNWVAFSAGYDNNIVGKSCANRFEELDIFFATEEEEPGFVPGKPLLDYCKVICLRPHL